MTLVRGRYTGSKMKVVRVKCTQCTVSLVDNCGGGGGLYRTISHDDTSQ